MESPWIYYQMDDVRDIAHPEQFQAVKKLGPQLFAVSEAIADVSIFFDPTISFRENIETICHKNIKRARFYNGNPFRNAYMAGIHTMYEKRIADGQSMPLICFDTIVDLEKDRRNYMERICPVSFERRDIQLYGSYSFADFGKKNLRKNSLIDEDRRLSTAFEFIYDVRRTKDLANKCRRNLCFDVGQEEEYFNPSLGNMYAASVSTIVKTAVGNHCDDFKIPVLTKQSDPNCPGNTVEEVLYNRKHNKDYVTREHDKIITGGDSCLRLTAPFRDPGAAYSFWELSRILLGKRPEGRQQAEKAGKFLNEQTQNFVLPLPQRKFH